jgi:hypothetical protein
LDTKGSIARWKTRIGEGFLQLKFRVIDLDYTIMKVAGIEEAAFCSFRDCKPFVDRTVIIGDGNHAVSRINRRTPSHDCSILGIEDEDRGTRFSILADHEIDPSSEDEACGS